MDFGVMLTKNKLFDLDFADDIALIGPTNEQLQACTDHLKSNTEKVGLRFNSKKCETMSALGNTANIKIDGVTVENVASFTYLGSKMGHDGKSSEEIRCRLGKASGAFGKMKQILTSKQIVLKTRLEIYHATVLSILLYGSETWQIYAAERDKLNVFHRGCLRKILGITYMDRITNREIINKTQEVDLEDMIRERRMRWFGHVARMDGMRVPKQVLDWNPRGKRKRGRPKLTWRETYKDFKKCDLSWDDAIDAAQDRKSWQFLTERTKV